MTSISHHLSTYANLKPGQTGALAQMDAAGNVEEAHRSVELEQERVADAVLVVESAAQMPAVVGQLKSQKAKQASAGRK